MSWVSSFVHQVPKIPALWRGYSLTLYPKAATSLLLVSNIHYPNAWGRDTSLICLSLLASLRLTICRFNLSSSGCIQAIRSNLLSFGQYLSHLLQTRSYRPWGLLILCTKTLSCFTLSFLESTVINMPYRIVINTCPWLLLLLLHSLDVLAQYGPRWWGGWVFCLRLWHAYACFLEGYSRFVGWALKESSLIRVYSSLTLDF